MRTSSTTRRQALSLHLSAALLVLASCASTRTPRSELAPGDDDRSASGLVWIVDASGRNATLWVSTEDGRSLASQPIEGPLWAVGSTLWQWVEEPFSVPLYACESNDGEPDRRAAIGHATVHHVLLRELTQSLELELVRGPTLEPVRALEHAARPVASVGPYVFVVEALRADACGVHAAEEARALVWDLEGARSVDVLTERERDAIAEAEAVEARRALAERSDGVVEIQLAALEPRWDGARGLSLAYLFVADACYACGDGTWGSYSIAAHVDARRLPEQLAGHARVPRWVRAALARAGGATLAGFTRVEHPAPARVLDTLRR